MPVVNAFSALCHLTDGQITGIMRCKTPILNLLWHHDSCLFPQLFCQIKYNFYLFSFHKVCEFDQTTLKFPKTDGNLKYNLVADRELSWEFTRFDSNRMPRRKTESTEPRTSPAKASCHPKTGHHQRWQACMGMGIGIGIGIGWHWHWLGTWHLAFGIWHLSH